MLAPHASSKCLLVFVWTEKLWLKKSDLIFVITEQNFRASDGWGETVCII